ncbi:MAG: branched-chain amino acid transport system substrate-binding protein, partial [Cellvibrionaceae bacterium]
MSRLFKLKIEQLRKRRRKKMKLLKKLLSLVILSSLLLVACREAPQAEPEPEPTDAPAVVETEEEPTEAPEPEPTPEPIEAEVGPIKIGFMGPLTGGAAFIGEEQLGFAKAVAKVFAEQTGLEIEIVEGDTEINPDTGAIVAERFAADADIIGVVGPAGSQVCESTQPIFAEAGLAHITPSCTKTDLTDPGTSTFFRPIPTDADQSQTVADHMIGALGIKSLYIVEDQSSYAVGLADELETLLGDAGVTIERVSVTQEETDFSSVATAAVAAGSDAVFMAGQIEGQLGTLAVQLREQGYDGIYYLPDGGFSLGWVETAGAAAENTYVSFFSPDPNLVPEAAPYNEVYAADVSPDFGAFGGAAGLATQVLLEAVGRCARDGDVSRACVVTELGNTDMSSTMLGIPMQFGAGNQAGGGFSLFQIQEGSFHLLSGADDAGMMAESEMMDVGPIKVAFLGPLTGGA